MQVGEHPADRGKFPHRVRAGVVAERSANIFEDLTSQLVSPQGFRGTGEASRLQVRKQRVDRVGPRPGRAADSVADAHDTAGDVSGQWFLVSHGRIVGKPAQLTAAAPSGWCEMSSERGWWLTRRNACQVLNGYIVIF